MATQDRTRARSAWVVAAAAALIAAQVAVVAIWPAAHLLMIDLQVYRAGGEAVLHGKPLYDGGLLLDLPFVYPPSAALVFVPLTLLPLPVLKIAWTAAGVAALVFVVRRSTAMLGREPRRATTALLVARCSRSTPSTPRSTSGRSTSCCSRWCSPTSPGVPRAGCGASGSGSRPHSN